MNVKKNKKGFTLMEMLIVVAIIAVLVAIAIPVLSNNLHKAKVATDWANVRALYANLQADYLTSGELIPEYYDTYTPALVYGKLEKDLHFYSDGKITQTIELKTGYFCVRQTDGAYQVFYFCNKGHPDCALIIGQGNSK